MEKKYVGSNVDLHLLVENLMTFFKDLGFATRKEETDKAYKIVATPGHGHDIRESVRVYTLGKPDNFSIKFVAGARSSAMVKWGSLTTLFGGGILLLRGLKSQDALEKLEKDFWMFVNEELDRLAGSAKAFRN